jgi:hypothetical protein
MMVSLLHQSVFRKLTESSFDMYSGSSGMGFHRRYGYCGRVWNGLAHGRSHEERHTQPGTLHTGTCP